MWENQLARSSSRKTGLPVTGRTANYWLNYYLITEAMILLRTTDLDIQEISDLLNFPAQSNFGKFFKRQTGQSPNNYRKSQE